MQVRPYDLGDAGLAEAALSPLRQKPAGPFVCGGMQYAFHELAPGTDLDLFTLSPFLPSTLVPEQCGVGEITQRPGGIRISKLMKRHALFNEQHAAKQTRQRRRLSWLFTLAVWLTITGASSRFRLAR